MPLEAGVWSSAIGQCSIYIVELKEKPVNSTKTITFWLTQTNSFLNFFLLIPNGSLWSAQSPSKSLKTCLFLDQLFFILVLVWRATMQLLLLIPMKLERYFFGFFSPKIYTVHAPLKHMICILFTHFLKSKNVFSRFFFFKFWPYVWLVFKSGF